MKFHSFVALGVLAGSAFTVQAADMYRAPEGAGYKDGPDYGPVYNWTGFYAGVNGGYAVGDWNGKLTYTGNGGDSGIEGNRSVNASGGFGGGQIGYNKQINAVVIGVEADISGSGFGGKGSFATIAYNPPTNTQFYVKNLDMNLDYFGTVRGRLGYAMGRFMPYLTGGLAWGHASLKNTVYDNLFSDIKDTGGASEDHVGWTAGAGVEWAMSGNWSVKGEWLYIDLGQEPYHITGTDNSTKYGGTIGPFTTDGYKSSLTLNTFKVGLNYKFGDQYIPLK